MKPFDKQTMLRLVNHDSVVCDYYLGLGRPLAEIEEALRETYQALVVGSVARAQKYESLVEKKPSVSNALIADPPGVAAVRELIKRLGWREFILALEQFARLKAGAMSAIGLPHETTAWVAVADKVSTLRKVVQL